MIATYPLRRELWQELYDRLRDEDVEEFNRAYGKTYSREQIAYMAPTILRIDDMLSGYYGREMSFRTKFLKVDWTEEFVIVQVEVIYRPVVIPN